MLQYVHAGQSLNNVGSKQKVKLKKSTEEF